MKRSKLSENLRSLLDLYAMTETQLAKELKIANTTFHRIINDNVSSPNISSLRPIAEHFGVTIDQLIGDSPLFINQGEKVELIRNRGSLVPILRLNFEDLEGVSALLKSIDPANWHNWMFTTLDQNENCFALEIADHTYQIPLLKGSIQIISCLAQYRSGDICLVLDKEHQFVGFKKLLLEGNATYLANIYAVNESMIEQDKNTHFIIGKVVQSIIDHEGT